jgi:hypothetical protein
LSFVPIATGALVVSACVLDAVAVFLTMEGMGQRTQNGKYGAVLLAVGLTLLLGFDFALYPLVTISNILSSKTVSLLTDIWIAFLPLGLFMIGVGANLRRTSVLLKRKRR